MSKQKLKKIVLKKIEKINDKIDLLILDGKPYYKESKQHKKLWKFSRSLDMKPKFKMKQI